MDEHRTLRIAMMAHGVIDLLSAALLLVYPQIVELAAPQLSINYFTERIWGAAFVAVGGMSAYAWTFTQREQFIELLIMKTIWANSVVLGFIVTVLQRPDLVSAAPLIIGAIFVLGAGTWSGFLASYLQRRPTKRKT